MKKVLISTAQRSGSTWLESIACALMAEESACYVGGLRFGTMRDDSDPEEAVELFSEFIRSKVEDFGLFKTHDLPVRRVSAFLNANPDFVVINISRDFRDVLISRLLYNRYYLPSIGRQIESSFVEANCHLNDCELIQSFLDSQEFSSWLWNWKLFHDECSHERYSCLRFEEMLCDDGLLSAIESVRRMASEDDFEISKALPSAILEYMKFSKIPINRKRNRKTAEVKSAFCRKGISGDYLNYLTDIQVEQIGLKMFPAV